ncbi:MAG: MFS transporter [Minwuia sp.]|nr:MFS transporter [Minwuia sp.]
MSQQANDISDRTRWGVAWVAIGAGIVCGMQVGKAPPMISGIRDTLGIDLVGAGFYMSIINGLAVAIGIIAGVFADQVGRRRAVTLGLVAIIAGNLTGALADSASVMYASRILEAVGFVGIVTAVPGMLSELVTQKDQRIALSAWSIYMPAGFCAMMAAAPLLASQDDWRLIWWLNGALVALFLMLFLSATRGIGGRPRQARSLSGLRAVASRPGPWLLGLIFMSYTTQWFGVLTWMPTIMEQAGLSTADAGLGVALVVGANMAGCLGSGPLLNLGLARWKIVVACSLALSALAFGIYDSSLSPTIRLLLAALFSAVGGLIPGAVLAGAPMHSPGAGNIGTTNGVIVQCTNLGSLLGPPAVAWLAVQADGDFGAARWLVLAAGLTGILLALTLRTVEQRMQAGAAAS